jgi:hypothetical protein
MSTIKLPIGSQKFGSFSILLVILANFEDFKRNSAQNTLKRGARARPLLPGAGSNIVNPKPSIFSAKPHYQRSFVCLGQSVTLISIEIAQCLRVLNERIRLAFQLALQPQFIFRANSLDFPKCFPESHFIMCLRMFLGVYTQVWQGSADSMSEPSHRLGLSGEYPPKVTVHPCSIVNTG